MARRPTGRPVGRQPRYQDDSERPRTVSLRIPADLHAALERYAAIHRQSLTEVILDGIRWRIGDGDLRGLGVTLPPQEVSAYYRNTARHASDAGHPDLTAVLHEMRELFSAYGEQMRGLPQTLEHRPLPTVEHSNTVIQQSAPQSHAPAEAAVPTDTAPYGALTDLVWEAAQRLRRFTPGELARTIGAKPKAVHEVLTRRVKRQDGTLSREGRYFVVEES